MARTVAEGAIFTNIKTRLLQDDTIRYVTARLEQAVRESENSRDDSELLADSLRKVEAKLAKVTYAIEAVGISETLSNHMRKLEREKEKVKLALQKVPAQVKFSLDVVPALVQRWLELAISIESLTQHPDATLDDIEGARGHLLALLGPVTLKPRNGILWGHPAPNAKGLTEVRPLDGLRINSPFSGSGGRISRKGAFICRAVPFGSLMAAFSESGRSGRQKSKLLIGR